ncbi:hypothetical protein ANN_23629 [Periplaneta americana]|uniref:Uncharacterized protein n=1 Tax=Periplaneta americana TaxID=6978 RepID=A0ABQ8SLM5_PERAM|nr:hypothetical protein ANN_23629 [Periplaneta americana]
MNHKYSVGVLQRRHVTGEGKRKANDNPQKKPRKPLMYNDRREILHELMYNRSNVDYEDMGCTPAENYRRTFAVGYMKRPAMQEVCAVSCLCRTSLQDNPRPGDALKAMTPNLIQHDDNNALSESVMRISYKIRHEITKELKTFNEGEFIKRCLIILADELCPQQVGEVEAIRLSRRTVERRSHEIETLGRVLGACPYGETLRIHRHHAIRTKLADALRKLKYTVYEEVHETADNGSNRRIDIIAISESLSQGIIIDPTITFETYKGQPEDVHEEKRTIYVPTFLYYKDKYQLHDISVTGLMFGARGTIPNFSSQFWNAYRRGKQELEQEEREREGEVLAKTQTEVLQSERR